MKKMKKALVFALAATMLVSVTGCGKDKEKTQWEKTREQVYENIRKQNSESATQNTNSNPSANNNTSANQNTTKPSSSGSSVSSGTKLPLDTTRNFQGLRLTRYSDHNDLIGASIKKNTKNKVSRLTGAEPEYKVAVDTFNEVSRKNNDFVAYKVLEYHQFDPSDKEFELLVKQSQYKDATEYYRFTFEIYQYEKSAEAAKYDRYTDTSLDPHYLRVTVYKANGKYNRVSYMTSH